MLCDLTGVSWYAWPHLVYGPWLVENGRGARVEEPAVNAAVVSENDITRVCGSLARVAVAPDPVARVHAKRYIVTAYVEELGEGREGGLSITLLAE
jgi:hypothetical protein